jgi:tubulin polyglutamylase TTLL9
LIINFQKVNASPSLTANTPDDRDLKMHMLHGALDIIDLPEVLAGNEEHVSGLKSTHIVI